MNTNNFNKDKKMSFDEYYEKNIKEKIDSDKEEEATKNHNNKKFWQKSKKNQNNKNNFPIS